MALTVTRPNYWTITLDSDQITQYKFKYVVIVKIGGAMLQLKITNHLQ